MNSNRKIIDTSKQYLVQVYVGGLNSIAYFVVDDTTGYVRISKYKEKATLFSLEKLVEINEDTYLYEEEKFIFNVINPIQNYNSLIYDEDGIKATFMAENFKLLSTKNDHRWILMTYDNRRIWCDINKFKLVTKKTDDSIHKHFVVQLVLKDDNSFDSRVKLNFQNNFIVFIKLKESSYNFGSGILISPNKVLTAAHVTENFLNKGGMTVHAGYSSSNLTPDLEVEKIDVHPSYKTTKKISFDISVITVKNKSPKYLPIGKVKGALNTKLCNWIGYPIDEIFRDEMNIQQYLDIGYINSEKSNNYIGLTKNSNAGGQSGSGLIITENKYHGAVIGVLSSTDLENLKFSLLFGSNFDFVNSHLN